LSCLLQLIVVALDLLLGSLIFLVKDHVVFLHHFLRTSKSVVHQLELVQVLLTIYQLIYGVLETVTLLLLSHLLLLLDDIVGFFELLSLILDFLLILAVLLKNHLFLLFHNFLFLLDNFLNSCLNTCLHLLNLITFANLTLL